MTIEEKLKELILSRYNSLRDFSIRNNIPHSTLVSILQRGIVNASVGNIIKICKALHISADALADGEIVYKFDKLPDGPVVEVEEIISEVKDRFTHAQEITINGKPVDIEFTDPIVEALDIGYEMSKKKTSLKAITKTITES